MNNVHACGLVIGDRGVIVLGPSGSGKSTLALALVARCRAGGMPAWLVGDDRLVLERRGARLVARVPETIAGLAEIYGHGPAAQPHEAAAVIDLCVRLVPARDAPRLDPGGVELIENLEIAALAVAQRAVAAAMPAVLARLEALGGRRPVATKRASEGCGQSALADIAAAPAAPDRHQD
jgi:serine kinase of HPr protein (carbohydrate metabolism regulator)